MGMFDYRDYSSEESIELINTSHDLAIYSQLSSAFGIPLGDIANGLTSLFPEGTIQGSATPDIGLPDGWRDITPSELGGGVLDSDGYYVIPSPLTGSFPTGAQVKIVGEFDENGNLLQLGISFTGTNSPVDIPDYFQLNSGEMGEAMTPLLELVADYAINQNLNPEDVIVTGYSLGGGYTNVMARYANEIADGFFANSNYFGHASPVIYEDNDRVLNYGAENDIVHRATGGHDNFWDALEPVLPFLTGQDYDLVSSTDNIIFFNGVFANPLFPLGPFSLLNPLGWWAHLDGAINDSIERISESHFYDLTEEDSVVIISNLGADLRGFIWVEDRATFASDHVDRPAFLIGTQWSDLFRDGAGNDYVDLGAGNDKIELTSGYDAVYGDSGSDTVVLDGKAYEWTAYRLEDGTIALFSHTGDGLKMLESVENIVFTGHDWNWFDTVRYSVQHNRLEDEHFSFFQWGDRDVAYSSMTSGDEGNNYLSGSAVFAMGGDDNINGTSGNDLLHGGEGEDHIIGGSGRDTIYGAEGNDILNGGIGDDILNGGHGDDLFIFSNGENGRNTIEDFNQSANENDMISFDGRFESFDDLIDHASTNGDDVIISDGSFTLTISNTNLADLSSDNFIF